MSRKFQVKMRKARRAAIKFFKDEEGATAIEYGLIAGLISVALVLTLTNLGDSLKQVFTKITEALTGAS